MKRLRLLAFDTSGVIERTYSRFPVLVGRHPENDLQIIDPRISRFHAQFRVESGVLVLRDVSSQNGTVVTVGPSAGAELVRGADVRAADGRLTVLLGGVRLEASIEDGEAADLPDALAPAVRDAGKAILGVCELHRERVSPARAGVETIGPVLDALSDGLLMMRFGLHADEVAPAGDRDGERARKEAASALLEWTHASAVALRLVEQSIAATRLRDACLLREATEAIDALLRELAPDKLESETTDVCAEWPAARATAVLARYRSAHRGLAERHARRPSALLGRAFAEVLGRAFAEVSMTQDANEGSASTSAGQASQRGTRLRSDALQRTSAETEEHPPSSER